jgi:hypothetical protein
MGTPGSDGQPVKPNPAAMCRPKSPTGQAVKKKIHSLHTAFTPKDAKNPTTVKGAKGSVPGKTASFTGDQVTIDGQTLTSVVLSHSSMGDKVRLKYEIRAAAADGRWYVTDMRFAGG